MPKTVQLLNTMSETLLNNMSSETQPVDISTGPLSLRLEKSKASDIRGKSIGTQHADVVLPKNLGTSNSNEDISLRVNYDLHFGFHSYHFMRFCIFGYMNL